MKSRTGLGNINQTLREVAKKLHRSARTLRDIEEGFCLPRKDRLPRFARAYNTSLFSLTLAWEKSKEGRHEEVIAMKSPRKMRPNKEMWGICPTPGKNGRKKPGSPHY